MEKTGSCVIPTDKKNTPERNWKITEEKILNGKRTVKKTKKDDPLTGKRTRLRRATMRREVFRVGMRNEKSQPI